MSMHPVTCEESGGDNLGCYTQFDVAIKFGLDVMLELKIQHG